jgi:hypothetical protein
MIVMIFRLFLDGGTEDEADVLTGGGGDDLATTDLVCSLSGDGEGVASVCGAIRFFFFVGGTTISADESRRIVIRPFCNASNVYRWKRKR